MLGFVLFLTLPATVGLIMLGRPLVQMLFMRGRFDAQAVEMVALAGFEDRKPGQLSGGQRQRVLIARALASKPRMLLLDEPTASVDIRAEQDIYNLLVQLNKQSTIILVTHDLSFVTSSVKRVACMNKRLVCHPTARISAELIEDLYRAPMHLVQHDHINPGGGICHD